MVGQSDEQLAGLARGYSDGFPGDLLGVLHTGRVRRR
jgi:hypothetical protein